MKAGVLGLIHCNIVLHQLGRISDPNPIILFAMTRKRALGRQQRDDTHIYTTNHRSTGWDGELGSSPSNSAPLYDSFGKKSHYRHEFLLKSNRVNGGRRLLRPALSGVLLKRISIFAILFVVSLTLPKLIFDAARYLTMSRPTVLYGSPTDWKEVAGCLSRTHRRDVSDHFGLDNSGDYHQYTQLPLNPDVVWNWSRYSSSHSTMSSEDGDVRSSRTNHAKVVESSLPRRRLLIAQYSGKGSYQKLLEEVEPINRAYAKRWGHDYTTLVGTGLKFPGLIYETSRSDSSSRNDDGDKSRENYRYCRYYNENENANGTDSSSMKISESPSYYNYEAQSTFNKIPLLFKAMEESPLKYDQVLILDSDTMIVDFEYDITSLLLASESDGQDHDDGDEKIRTNSQLGAKNMEENTPVDDNHNLNDDFSYFLVAYRVWKFDWISTWDVNAGITLWNLNHPHTKMVAEAWLRLSLSDPKGVLLKNDDQYYLQRALQKLSSSSTFVRGDQKHSTVSAFDMKSFWNWWRGHSFLPILFDHYRDSASGKGVSDSAGSTATGRYNDLRNGGVGIRAVRDEFKYYNATVIKHFKRDTASWSRTGLDQRLLRIREVKVEICRLWPNDCPS